MGHRESYNHQLLLLSLILLVWKCQSWGWFSSSSTSTSTDYQHDHDHKSSYRNSIAEFSMEGLNDMKGVRFVEKAKKKLASANSCWQNAYGHLFSGCSEILAVDEKRSRFAWHLSDCFQKDSGRPPFPSCDPKSTSLQKCLKALNEAEHKVYLEFYLETSFICYQLQAHAFKHETERLVNELKTSAQEAEEKLETIEYQSEYLLQNTKRIQDSLNSTDSLLQEVAQASRNVEDHIGVVSKNSEAIYEQSKRIASTQSEIQQGQSQMKESLEEGMVALQETYSGLGQEIAKLRNETMGIEKEILVLGDEMFMKMNSLQSKANDIGDIAGDSLDKQQQLLDAQSMALKRLESLSNYQSQALEESRRTMQKLAEYGHKQREELLRRQEQIQSVHNRLMESSKSILDAQESFESKQASMFAALDRLFALHNAMLVESCLIKVFFIHSILIFIIYMLTSTKQTYTVRPWLYIEVCVAFIVEVAVIRFISNYIEQKTWTVNTVRSSFLLLAFLQLLYAICTYRDYEVLNHQILLTLVEKVSGIQREHRELSWGDEGMHGEINWSKWIDSDLPEDIGLNEDPDYAIPYHEVGDKSIATVSSRRRYNLRRR